MSEFWLKLPSLGDISSLLVRFSERANSFGPIKLRELLTKPLPTLGSTLLVRVPGIFELELVPMQQGDGDVNSTNPQGDHQDVSAAGATEADADKASSQIAAHRKASTSSSLPGEGISNHSVDASGPDSKLGRQIRQDGLLHISPEGGVNMRPTEASLWNWDTPLESVGESSSYYYEPQGELLQEQKEHREVEAEFNIPHAISASGVQWPFSTTPLASGSNDGFAVPKRPSAAPQSVAGSKRKAMFDREATAGSKRSSRMTSDSGEEESPAHNTRSQSGTSTRARSATDTSDTRSRPLDIDIDTTGLHGSATGPRTLSDPSIPMVLPARKVFPIQIGDKLFRLSGASISSDGT